MTLIAWTCAFHTNVREIDAQHRRLVEMLNQLHSAVRAGKGREALHEVLESLVTYTRTHFAYEEKLMGEHGYPDLPAHKAEHDRLTRQVAEFQAKLAENRASVTIEVIMFLHDWLLKHILTVDKKYGPYLNERGVM